MIILLLSYLNLYSPLVVFTILTHGQIVTISDVIAFSNFPKQVLVLWQKKIGSKKNKTTIIAYFLTTINFIFWALNFSFLTRSRLCGIISLRCAQCPMDTKLHNLIGNLCKRDLHVKSWTN